MRTAQDGEPNLLVFYVPEELRPENSEFTEIFALPVMARKHGLLLAVPMGALNEDKLIDAMQEEGDGILGPSRSFDSDLVVEAQDGTEVLLGAKGRFMVVDFSEAVYDLLRDYDPDTDITANIRGFSLNHEGAVPSMEGLVARVKEWAASPEMGRAHFYSAREEPAVPKSKAAGATPKRAARGRITNQGLMEAFEGLSAQVQLLQSQAAVSAAPVAGGEGRQEVQQVAIAAAGQPPGPAVPKMPRLTDMIGNAVPNGPALPKLGGLLSPPPRTRAAGFQSPQVEAMQEGEEPYDPTSLGVAGSGDPLLAAISQQSTALTALVAHLSAGGDPLMDLGGGYAGASTSTTRGVARREKLIAELSSGSSTFFFQMLQQMHRRLHPSRPAPKTDAEVRASGLSMLTYMERMGGFKNQRETGLILWILGHAIDDLIAGRVHMAQEHLALLVVSLEQSALDRGDWNIPFLLALVEEPPVQVFQDRVSTVSRYGRPFAPLVPANWAAICLGYLKELEVLNNKKSEATSSPKKKNGGEEEESPSPKRKQRFPRKPKGEDQRPQ